MQISDEVYQAIVIKELKHEARLSDRQVKMLEWWQITDNKQIRTRRDREVVISEELFNAIVSLPVSGRKVFNTPLNSPLLEVPECPERVETPVVDDIRERLAQLIAEKLLA